MPTGVEYDPARIRELARRARAVVDHLAAMPSSADPLALGAVSTAASVRDHVQTGWLAALARVEASTALLAPCADGGVISSVVARFTPEERTYFQGFVDASASGVAAELSRYDEHGEYEVDRLPAELVTLDSPDVVGSRDPVLLLSILESQDPTPDEREAVVEAFSDEHQRGIFPDFSGSTQRSKDVYVLIEQFVAQFPIEPERP